MEDLLLKGQAIGKVNGILFDKDGTLINSEERLLELSRSRVSESINLFKNQGYPSSDISKLRSLLTKSYGLMRNGIDPNGSIAIASKKDNLITTATVFCLLGKTWPNALKDANNVFETSFIKSIHLKKKDKKEALLDGLINFLEKAKKKKLKLAIISNDNKDGIKQFLKNTQTEDYFPFIWSSEDYPTKPNPESISKLCKLMNIKITVQRILVKRGIRCMAISIKTITYPAIRCTISITIFYLSFWTTFYNFFTITIIPT